MDLVFLHKGYRYIIIIIIIIAVIPAVIVLRCFADY
jgi:hypothetical protein